MGVDQHAVVNDLRVGLQADFTADFVFALRQNRLFETVGNAFFCVPEPLDFDAVFAGFRGGFIQLEIVFPDSDVVPVFEMTSRSERDSAL